LRSAVAFDGTNYLVVWGDNQGGSEWDIYGARVDTAGFVLDTAGIAISTAQGHQVTPSVTFDGNNYVLVWTDGRNDEYGDIYGAMVSPAGIVIESFAISDQSGNQGSPVIVYGTGDQLLITYTGWCDTINNHPANTVRIWANFYPFEGIEEDKVIAEKRIRGATIISGPLLLPEGKKCRVFDITGRVVAPDKMLPGIYFVEIDGHITQKVIKVR
jgi:hypothetical protein